MILLVASGLLVVAARTQPSDGFVQAGAASRSGRVATSQSLAGAVETQHISPLEWYADGEGLTLERIVQLEMDSAACMRAHGWKYTPYPEWIATSTPTDVAELRRYRSTVGYGIHSEMERGQRPDPNAAYVASLSRDEQLRYARDLGGSTDEGAAVQGTTGCRGAVIASIRRQSRVASDPKMAAAIFEAYRTVQSNSQVAAALGKWAECMASSGYGGLNVPGDARNLAQTKVDAGATPAEEVALAVADLRCQERELAPVLEVVEGPIVKRLQGGT